MERSAAPVSWRGRDAIRLSSELVELTCLTRGGHLAELQFTQQSGMPACNVLWEAPWMLPGAVSDPLEELHKTAGMTGHGMCLDYFGAPSRDEAAAGLGIHGEAAATAWDATLPADGNEASAQWKAGLDFAGLDFERTIRLGNQESVLYIEEKIHNRRKTDRVFHWVQHVTFSPPFLQAGDSTFAVSATRGLTSPSGYEGCSLLAHEREFSWPHAPASNRQGFVDLRRPFVQNGYGFTAALQLDPGRDFEHLVAVNWRLGLGVGYCFRRKDFPWIAVWEENHARQDSPWHGIAQARGMEFGTTPLPLGREESLRRGALFDTPSWCVIPGSATITARYLIFLFTVPAGMTSLTDVNTEENLLALFNQDGERSLELRALGCSQFLCQTSELPGTVR